MKNIIGFYYSIVYVLIPRKYCFLCRILTWFLNYEYNLTSFLSQVQFLQILKGNGGILFKFPEYKYKLKIHCFICFSKQFLFIHYNKYLCNSYILIDFRF